MAQQPQKRRRANAQSAHRVYKPKLLLQLERIHIKHFEPSISIFEPPAPKPTNQRTPTPQPTNTSTRWETAAALRLEPATVDLTALAIAALTNKYRRHHQRELPHTMDEY